MPRPHGPQATRPVYLRLRDQIAAAIIEGRYREGELLPSVRAFAAEQGANPLTVAKAYQQFQDDGLLEVRRGIGIAVMPGARARLMQAERSQFLTEEWPAVAERIALLDLDLADLMPDVDGGRSRVATTSRAET
ncbi:GntR family transcriptional regulator [Croceicoccus sp. BE223]|uniref:GntR family transcriptional regulator n=1 Tax=Croceicoccus sp. BE223 TaxID=2817716 RepID=UPI002866D75E|nr:GntR family transcriptional regulator [Croceicoccus sp. BE223]MDR7100897.1 GntR family transcriptional regulator [Croceicoccus sp. BE223]